MTRWALSALILGMWIMLGLMVGASIDGRQLTAFGASLVALWLGFGILAGLAIVQILVEWP